MNRYSILDQSASSVAALPKAEPTAVSPANGNETMRFPGEDGGKSLAETARGDLDAALQLLVERAKYITGALAATISLYEDGELICHACTGTPKQKTGTHLQVGSGLAGESVRTRRILRCNDTSVDLRTNSEDCRKYGISSAMVMPLVRGPEVVGVFELLSGTTQAFEERDLSALARLGEMVETAMEQAETAKQVPQDTFFEEELPQPEIGIVPLKLDPGPADLPAETPLPAKATQSGEAPLLERGIIGNCQACGFPVSGHRRLCVECAASHPKDAAEPQEEAAAPAFLAHLDEPRAAKRSWLSAHGYTLGTLVVATLTAVVVIWMQFPEVPTWILQHLKLH
jgi:putative methionine-R-sulfoxide reductase with GAF domain